MSSKKAIISACLLGKNCRYDAKTKESKEVLEFYKDYEILPFCPESPLFGTPRQRISVVQVDGQNRIITDETNEDVTQKLQDEIHAFVLEHQEVESIVLKSKSPSCGYGTTPILNEKKEQIALGNGCAVDIFLKKYPNIIITDENNK